MDAEAALIGRTIAGRYRIERCIGRGGMAAVFAARQDAEPHEVAVKVMKRELMKDSTVVKRFRREAKAAAMLHHPNTVKVLDYGVDGEDAYIAMELASGKDLFQALAEERPMTQTRAALIVAQVGAALSAAHAQGIVHRDLKPENVMLVPDESVQGGELVKVLDFGIAKILEQPADPKAPADAEPPQRSETSTNLTRVGTVVGTPAYMSPEQCRGGELDGRSDVYSSGVLLYQLLTGQLPFMGETPLHTAMRHIHAPPRPPSEVRAGLHKGLERIVLKALAKWPGERQQSAEQLREELLGVIDALPDRDRVLGAKTGPTDPQPEDDDTTGQRGPAAETRDATQAPPIQRQPTEAQVGMRLGGGLGKLVNPAISAKASSRPPPPPPAATREDTDDELERSETPARIVDPPVTTKRAAAGAPRAKWSDDDDERTRLRPVTGAGGVAALEAAAAAPPARGAPPPPDDDDDDGPRTALMAPESSPGRARPRPNKTLLMEEESAVTAPRAGSAPSEVTTPRPTVDAVRAATASEITTTRPNGSIASDPNIRSTVRLGSPAPVAAPPPPARKDITPAAFARTQNSTAAEIAAGLLEEEAAAQAQASSSGDFAGVKATRRLIVDEASSGGGPLPAVGMSAGVIAPPLAPPPPAPRPIASTSGALTIPAPRRDVGVRGSLEQLPGTTVLVVGVALGVVFSAVVILVIIFVARG